MSMLDRCRALCRVLVIALVVVIMGGALSCAASPKSPATASSVPDAPAEGIPDRVVPAESDSEPGSTAAKREKDSDIGGPVYEYAAPTEVSPSAAAPKPAIKGYSDSRAETPAQSGLKAGYADDNKQFNYFVDFLAKYKDVPHYDLKIDERILISIRDSDDRPVMNARITVKSGTKTIATGTSYADGGFALYPLELGGDGASKYLVEASAAAGTAAVEIDRSGPRSVTVRLQKSRLVPEPLPVDVLFVLDTTGSMGEEIERLKATIEIINANIVALKPKPDLRFGMVLYKDKGDEYDTSVVPFTNDLDLFQQELNEVYAEGGGDDPEDLQAALEAAVKNMKWNAGGVRVGFVITDAATHLDYGQTYTYADAIRDAKAAGVKFHSIGVGGLPLDGEYILRQIAQYTQGRYIFLTYGEQGESEGGRESAVSHHTGSNWSSDKLESIVIRFVKEEIALQSSRPLEEDESYYTAKKAGDESAKDILHELFKKALGDLSDYSSLRIDKNTRCAILPISVAEGSPQALAAQAEYFSSELALSAADAGLFTLVERKDLQRILAELELQLSGLADEESAAKVGGLLGAQVLVTGTLFERADRYELFLKLLRVETAELLSAVKARIDPGLGL